ncbi:MAG: hypothetical protein WDW38_004341 [Sanguina aurantia]
MLCQILRDTSSGRDVSTAALEVIKLDISHSDGDISAAALDFLPHMPGTYLASLLIVGELAPAVSGHLSSKDCEVRTAAVGCLARVLLLPEVLLAAHSTPGLAASLEALWDSCGDALLDLESVVVATAVQAVTRLFRAAMSLSEGGDGAAAAADSGAGYVLCRLAARQALRVATALGPVLEMCQLLPYALQAHVAVMLPLLAGTVAAAPPQPPAILGAAPLPPAASLRVILPASTAYLLRHIHSIHSGTCLEACRQLIQIHRTFGRPEPGSGAPVADLGTGSRSSGWGGADAAVGMASLVGVSEGLSSSDVQCVVAALLQMRERQLSEAGLAEVALVVAQALPLLPASSRADTLRQLWPLLTRITDIPQRMAVAACAWQAVVTAELAGRARSAAAAAAPAPADQLDPFATATMVSSTGYQQQAPGFMPAVAVPYVSVTSVLADSYLDILMKGRVPTLEGFSDAAELRPPADARPSAKLAAAARDPALLHVGDVPEDAAAFRLGAGQQLSTLRHELVLMLVGVMRAQPGACAAAGLAWEAWAGARRDVAVAVEGEAGHCSARALQWLSSACATLDSTAAWGRERPFLFDVACASALCESPEYESSSLHVSLVVLQLLTARLVNCASAAAAATAAAAKAAAAAGSDRGRNRASNNGRVSSSGVQDGLQSVDLAKGFEALLKALLGSEVTGSAPHVRDWCKRLMKQLNVISTVTPPPAALLEEEEEEEEAEDGVDLDPGSGQDGLPVGPVVTGSQDPDYDSDESSPRFAAPVANGSLQASPQVAAAVAAVPEVPAEESQVRSG